MSLSGHWVRAVAAAGFGAQKVIRVTPLMFIFGAIIPISFHPMNLPLELDIAL